MSVKVKDLTITSLETITAFDLGGDYLYTLDELQSATIAQAQETTEITGKGGRKLSTLKRNKAVTISGNNGLVSGGLLEMQTGSRFDEKETEVFWTDYLTVQSNAASTSFKAVGTAGAEILGLYTKGSEGALDTKYEQAAAAAAGKFTYDPSTKAIAFASGEIADGTEIVVYYNRTIRAAVLENKSDNFSGKCTLYVDALAEDLCANVYRVQFYIPKADFSGEFSFDMGDNQTVHAFEAESLAGACGAGGNLFTYTVFGVGTADADD